MTRKLQKKYGSLVRPFVHLIAMVAILLGLGACAEEQKLFTEVGEAAGLKSTNRLSPTEELNIITYLYYYNGGGVAATDINGDGLADLYFTNNQGDNRYYINEGNWQFRDATELAGVGGQGAWSTGVSVTDVNQDGLPDIYVCNVSGYLNLTGGNELFVQQADGTFVESAAAYGLDFEGFATQMYWTDFDQDGDQDAYLLTHSVHNDATYGPASFRQKPDSIAGDRLYECITKANGQRFYRLLSNDGSQSSKAISMIAGGENDALKSSGIYSSKIGYGLSLAQEDFNEDGLPDLYVCNDFSENDYLYLNSGSSGTIYRESIRDVMGHSSAFSMGSDVGDFDNDGLADLFTLDMRPADPVVLKHTASADPYTVYRIKRQLDYHHQYPRNNLQWNRGEGRYSEIAQFAGVEASDWSWSALAADFDLNGYQDIFVTNGIWRRPNDLDFLKFISASSEAAALTNLELAEKMPSGLVGNVAFRNSGNLNFDNAAQAWGLDQVGSSNGSAYADFDQDGDLDLVVNNLNAPASLYRNNSAETLGDTVTTLPTPTGVQAQFLSSGKVVVRWGPATSQIPYHLLLDDGSSRRIFPATQRGMQSQSEAIAIFQLPGSVKPLRIEAIAPTSASDEKAIVQLELTENAYTDFDVSPLQPYALSALGPAVAKGRVGNQAVLFIGGAHGERLQLAEDHPGLALLQGEMAGDLLKDSLYEDVDALFFDADGDGDDDLYVVSGGGQISVPTTYFQDRLYLQEGKQLIRCEACLPDKLADNGSCVATGDFDDDGDLDLFIGGSVKPGDYGIGEPSRILLNDGTGRFTQDAAWTAHPWMVTDAIWQADRRRLIVAGSWQPIRSFTYDEGKWAGRDISASGLWRSLADLGAGNFAAGNWGENSGLGKPSSAFPLRLYVADLDKNGRMDPLITQFTAAGSEISLADKDEIVAQLPSWKKNNLSYVAFASKDFVTNFAQFELPIPLEVTDLKSGQFLEGEDGNFAFNPFPLAAQLSCINDLLVAQDGSIYLSANQHEVLPRIGRQDAAALQRWSSEKGLHSLSTQLLGHHLEGKKIVEIDADRLLLLTSQ